MTSKDDSSDRRKVSRSGSLLGDSFKMGASLLQGFSGAGKNIKHLTLDNVYPIDKEDFQQKDQCCVCYVTFNKIIRRHHCRTCGRSCCSDCSCSTINKDRACDVCIYKYQQPQKDIIKEALLERLKINAMQYLGGRLYLDEQYKSLELQIPNPQQIEEQKAQTKARIEKLEAQVEEKHKISEKLKKDLEDYRSS